MKDIPIIFSAPMVRSLLDGRKTMTRRLATRPNGTWSPWTTVLSGDRLWVRENWKPHSIYAGMKPRDVPPSTVFYQADNAYAPSNTPWVPCIHMPRWASRLTLLVAAAGVERLRDINDADALAEGVQAQAGQFEGCFTVPGTGAMSGTNARDCFARLWNSLHGAGSWESNPDAVVLRFEVHKANIDAMPKLAA